MVQLYFAKIEDYSDNNLQILLSYLHNFQKERINKYHFLCDKMLSVYSYILTNSLINKTLRQHVASSYWCKNEYGKPFLHGFDNFHFNISHTKTAITVAIADLPIGVDIEKIQLSEQKIALRFFSKNEAEYILTEPQNSDIHFFEIWTKKEAYLKYLGKGLSEELNSFDVLTDDISQKFQCFQIEDYIISICTDASSPCKVSILSQTNIEQLAANYIFNHNDMTGIN